MYSSYNSENFETPLHEAIMSNNLQSVRELLNQGTDKNSEDSEGYLIFTRALTSEKEIDPEILKLLQPDDDYWTATDCSLREKMKLHQILRRSRMVLEVFLNCCNVDWKATDFWGTTPLHILATNEHYDVFDLFLNVEFSVDARDREGHTALHCAARYHSKYAIEFLLNRGVDVNVANSEGMTPLLCTVQSFSTGFNDYTAHSPITCEFKDCAMLLLENGANPQVAGGGENGPKSFFELVDECHICSYHRHCAIDDVLEAAVAHVAIDEMRGIPIQGFITRDMNEDDYENCVQQLNQMKEEIMFGTITVFQFLTESEDKVAKFARSQDAVEWFEWFEHSVEGYGAYYNQLLKKRFFKATKLNRWKDEAAHTISQAINRFGSDHIVTEKIVNYLECKDLVKYS